MTKLQLDQTVEDVFDIDINALSDLADSSNYWQNSFDFYVSVKDRWLTEMSEDQLKWLERIEADL
jgi:hypothetical protein